MKQAQVHRFRDHVAAFLANGETVYLTPKEARAFARALNKAARSCDRETYIANTVGTIRIPIHGRTAAEASQ
jgi:hypothetical protein